MLVSRRGLSGIEACRRFLTDQGYRERLVEAHVTDPAVRAYWLGDFGKRARREQREMCGSVLNKAGELCRDPVMRNIFGWPAPIRWSGLNVSA